ncbi:exosortase F system-associated membrane protein [Phaeocystidibacter marisrubri]|uniref:Exosortase F system-associated protein n=1 Tax=Phaeocystidibacter marisrubri TaxID=1577780 RepID=A0A6L3ZIS7_9FLAO|nr:exosortase F system-associated protein [Phaeocystidibacter marisrubri]KAB2817791.1 exosortase F system-associated protein [Phaeocystidibacter marisrubri]GGH73519.1 hypothetical protein GCM10011318_18620 [Phaeocystidibacter marisrubri]
MMRAFKNANWLIVAAAIIGLGSTYLMQAWLNPHSWLHGEILPWTDTWEDIRFGSKFQVVLNKAFRYLLNDLFSILLIHGLFQNRTYTRFAVWVLIFGLFVLVPIYLLLVFYAPSGYSSMISHLHRIIMNPVLMMLLIPYYYMLESQKKEE